MKKDLTWMKNSINQSSKYTDGDKDLYGDEWVVSRDLVIDLISQIEESEVPEIPSFVAKEIEFMQRKEKELGHLPRLLGTTDLGEDKKWFDDAQKWKEANYMKYCDAYANGFKVAPTLYTVEDKHGNNLLYKVTDGIGIAVRKGEVVTELSTLEEGSLLLTEKEIKDFDEKYWIFAEPTEELKE